MSSNAPISCPCCQRPAAPEELTTSCVVPDWEATEGTPWPLGVSWIVAQQAWNFAVYSRHATEVTLLLFNDDVSRPLLRIGLDPLCNKSGPVWHGRVQRSDFPDAKYYAWQIDGPPPEAGFEWHTFDAEKSCWIPTPRPSTFRQILIAMPPDDLDQIWAMRR